MRCVYHGTTFRRASWWLGAGLLAAGLGMPGAARAQLFDRLRDPAVAGNGTDPGVTVLSRLRPEYDAPGVRLGAVGLAGDLTSSTGYDDNVLGTASGRGSVLQQTDLNLRAATNWSRNGLAASLQVDDYRFLDLPAQSYTTYSASVGGFYEVGRDRLDVAFDHQTLAQTPRDLNTAQLDSTINYRIDTGDLGYTAVFNRLSVRPGLQVSRYDFDNGVANGQTYLQTYRNRIVATPQVGLAYELSPQRNVVAVVREAVASYRAPYAGQLVRDYRDLSALAGLDYQLTGPLRFRALAGFETRSFTSRGFKTISAPVAELNLIWTPTGLTTVTAVVSRQIADSADETTAGLTTTGGKLSVDHELKRNVLLHGEGGVEVASFGQGGGSQTLYTAGAGVTWLLNRRMRLGATYAFTARQTGTTGQFGGSTPAGTAAQPAGGNYNGNRILLQLRFGL